MKAINMKRMEIVTLFNSTLNDKEEYRVMNIGSADLNASKQVGGSEELKELLRERITDLFNGDILDYFNDSNVLVTEDDVDYCINELAKGNASNIAGEDFYWGDVEDVVYDIHSKQGQSDENPAKVWVMTQESNVDGEVHFNVVVCDSEETAKAQMQKEIDWIKNESFHFRDFKERGDDFEVEQGEHRFFINDETDDYYEEIMVMEKEITTL